MVERSPGALFCLQKEYQNDVYSYENDHNVHQIVGNEENHDDESNIA